MKIKTYENLSIRLKECKAAIFLIKTLKSNIEKKQIFEKALFYAIRALLSESVVQLNSEKILKLKEISLKLQNYLIDLKHALVEIANLFNTSYIHHLFNSLSEVIVYNKTNLVKKIECIIIFLQDMYKQDQKKYETIKANQFKISIIMTINSISLGIITLLIPYFSILSNSSLLYNFAFDDLLATFSIFPISFVIIFSYLLASFQLIKYFFPRKNIYSILLISTLLYFVSLFLGYSLLFF